jgi:O-antigen ligase
MTPSASMPVNSSTANTGPLQILAAFAVLTYVFFITSRLLDFSLAHYHIPLVVLGIAAAAVTIGGAFRSFLAARAAKLYLAITLCLVLGAPFGFYRRGAVTFLTNDWLRIMVFVVVVVGAIDTHRRTVHLMNTIAFAVLIVAIIGVTRGSVNSEGRLIIADTFTLDNPNGLAFVLVLGVPMWWRYMGPGNWSILRRCVGAAALATIAVCFLKTASRGGLVALMVLVLFGFLRASLAGKMGLALVVLLAVAAAASTLPKRLSDRFQTFVSAGEGDLAADALASTEARKEVFWESVRITLLHPIFGVGPGMFGDAENVLARAEGKPKGYWLGTHNTYTQVSSECGIPVLIMFLALWITTLRSLRAATKAAEADPRPIAADLRRSSVAAEATIWQCCAFLFFAHLGYTNELHLIICTGVVVSRAVRRELGVSDVTSWTPSSVAPAFRHAELAPSGTI